MDGADRLALHNSKMLCADEGHAQEPGGCFRHNRNLSLSQNCRTLVVEEDAFALRSLEVRIPARVK